MGYEDISHFQLIKSVNAKLTLRIISLFYAVVSPTVMKSMKWVSWWLSGLRIWSLLHYVYVPHLLNPVICWWTFKLFSCNRTVLFYLFFVFLSFIGLHLWHMEVPRLGSNRSCWAFTSAMWDLSQICNLHHSSRQCWILNPLSNAKDWIHILMDPSWVC